MLRGILNAAKKKIDDTAAYVREEAPKMATFVRAEAPKIATTVAARAKKAAAETYVHYQATHAVDKVNVAGRLGAVSARLEAISELPKEQQKEAIEREFKPLKDELEKIAEALVRDLKSAGTKVVDAAQTGMDFMFRFSRIFNETLVDKGVDLFNAANLGVQIPKNDTYHQLLSLYGLLNACITVMKLVSLSHPYTTGMVFAGAGIYNEYYAKPQQAAQNNNNANNNANNNNANSSNNVARSAQQSTNVDEFGLEQRNNFLPQQNAAKTTTTATTTAVNSKSANDAAAGSNVVADANQAAASTAAGKKAKKQ